jgi:hypothetical protein
MASSLRRLPRVGAFTIVTYYSQGNLFGGLHLQSVRVDQAERPRDVPGFAWLGLTAQRRRRRNRGRELETRL